MQDTFTKLKINQNKELLSPYFSGDIEVFLQKDNYRSRAQFSIFHQNDEVFYAMSENGCKKIIHNASFVEQKITQNMQILLNLLNNKHKTLRHRLFEVRFATSSNSDKITLLYHKNIDEIQDDLQNLFLDLQNLTNANLVALSRKKKLVFGKEYLEHKIEDIDYIFSDECFIQPSLFMNEKMLKFVAKSIQNVSKKDLLELYCGYGNFSIYLAKYFDKILATELSKTAIFYANENKKLNNINNLFFARLNDIEIKSAIKKERPFRRLSHLNLDDFNFSHILIDPPRAGLGECVDFVKDFENIIYISCNPLTLKKDLSDITKTHKVVNLAFFDQFKNTPHLECGVILKRIR